MEQVCHTHPRIEHLDHFFDAEARLFTCSGKLPYSSYVAGLLQPLRTLTKWCHSPKLAPSLGGAYGPSMRKYVIDVTRPSYFKGSALEDSWTGHHRTLQVSCHPHG